MGTPSLHAQIVRCRICGHAAQSAIEVASGSATVGAVAERFGVSEASLRRHLSSHEKASGVRERVTDDADQDEPSPSTVRSVRSEVEAIEIVASAPDYYRRICRVMIDALREYDEARVAVIAAIEREAAR